MKNKIQILERLNIPKQYSQSLYAKTKKYQEKYRFELGSGNSDTWNNEADAFKHTFGAAEKSLLAGTGLSKAATDFHELQQVNNPPYEENMDKWNNLEGRKIADEIKKEYTLSERIKMIKNGEMDDIIADKVMQKMKKGELITNPYEDTRKFNDKKFMDTIFNIKNRVFHEKEVSLRDLDNPIMRDTFIDQALEYKKMPTKENLDERVKTGELVYVTEYTREDGTKVSGYYRSYPNI